MHRGGCHCGRVRFEARAPAAITALDCNCSVCAKSGYLHLVVPKADFTLLSGADALTTYQFNTRTARHLFCSVCGIKSFYLPRSHPDGVSVNARCLDAGTVERMKVEPFNGQEWEASVGALHAARPPSAYVIAHFLVPDIDAYRRDYGRKVLPQLASVGGELLVASGNAMVLEGQWHPTWTAVIEFPSRESALRWYTSAEYAPLKQLRLEVLTTGGSVVLFEAYPPPEAAG